MSKATPRPGSINREAKGIDFADCDYCPAGINRAHNRQTGRVGPWWHKATGRVTCMETSDQDGDD